MALQVLTKNLPSTENGPKPWKPETLSPNRSRQRPLAWLQTCQGVDVCNIGAAQNWNRVSSMFDWRFSSVCHLYRLLSGFKIEGHQPSQLQSGVLFVSPCQWGFLFVARLCRVSRSLTLSGFRGMCQYTNIGTKLEYHCWVRIQASTWMRWYACRTGLLTANASVWCCKGFGFWAWQVKV